MKETTYAGGESLGEVGASGRPSIVAAGGAADGRVRRSRAASKRVKPSRAPGQIRYFLTKAESNGKPDLDQEMEDEQQALAESFKLGRTFVAVTEWRSKIDTSKGTVVIEKEPVRPG